jgi:hypothetical protein
MRFDETKRGVYLYWLLGGCRQPSSSEVCSVPRSEAVCVVARVAASPLQATDALAKKSRAEPQRLEESKGFEKFLI